TLAGAPLAVEQGPDVVDIWEQLGRDLGQLAHQRVLGDLSLPEPASERIVVHEQAVDLGAQRAEVLEVLRPDGAPSRLVLVGRTDAAPGGADRLLAGGRLPQLV